MMRTQRPPSVYSQDDPLTLAMRPPEEETEEERQVRLQQEAEAKVVSEKIDESLRQDRKLFEKRKADVKLLLLGQSESGKSTLQKQFQLLYSPGSLEAERVSWRVVVYFNVLRSVKQILATLEAWGDMDEDDSVDSGYGSSRVMDGPSSAAIGHQVPISPNTSAKLHKTEIATLRLRLSPLVAAESQVADRLTGGVSVAGSGKGGVYVRSGWQAHAVSQVAQVKRTTRPASDAEAGMDELVDDVASMLAASRKDIKDLWDNPTVKALISRRKLRLDEWSEFFLSDILRIAARDYVPSTEDILHARIQTMGVAEHFFNVNIHGKTVPWHLYDVGGARGQRHTWVPYFDDANAIIFVAPISAFDQYLDEDPRTNRIDDSLQLFTQICSNQLLKKVHLVLFLNKTDLLKKKIDRGMSVKKYITSYGDRANEFETVVNYFRAHFMQVHRKNNENKRVLYTHLTSVVDTKTTQSIIGNVRDSIFRGYLQSAALV